MVRRSGRNYCSSFIIQWYLCTILVPLSIPGMLLCLALVPPLDRRTLCACGGRGRGATFARRHSRRRWRPVLSTRFSGRRQLLHTTHYVRRCGNKAQTIKKKAKKKSGGPAASPRPPAEFTCRLSTNDGKGTTATRGGEGRSAPLAEESHYSVMDCTRRAVSALFILPEHWPRPLNPFPYPSEIYHVRTRATRGMAARARRLPLRFTVLIK